MRAVQIHIRQFIRYIKCRLMIQKVIFVQQFYFLFCYFSVFKIFKGFHSYLNFLRQSTKARGIHVQAIASLQEATVPCLELCRKCSWTGCGAYKELL